MNLAARDRLWLLWLAYLHGVGVPLDAGGTRWAGSGRGRRIVMSCMLPRRSRHDLPPLWGLNTACPVTHCVAFLLADIIVFAGMCPVAQLVERYAVESEQPRLLGPGLRGNAVTVASLTHVVLNPIFVVL